MALIKSINCTYQKVNVIIFVIDVQFHFFSFKTLSSLCIGSMTVNAVQSNNLFERFGEKTNSVWIFSRKFNCLFWHLNGINISSFLDIWWPLLVNALYCSLIGFSTICFYLIIISKNLNFRKYAHCQSLFRFKYRIID